MTNVVAQADHPVAVPANIIISEFGRITLGIDTDENSYRITEAVLLAAATKHQHYNKNRHPGIDHSPVLIRLIASGLSHRSIPPMHMYLISR